MFKNIKFVSFWDGPLNEIEKLAQKKRDQIKDATQIKENKIRNEGDTEVLSLIL